MCSQRFRSFLAKKLASPIINLKKVNLDSIESTTSDLRQKLSQIKYPFAIVSLKAFQDDPKIKTCIKESCNKINSESKKNIYVVDKNYEDIKKKSILFMKRHLPENSSRFLGERKNVFLLKFNRMRPEIKGKFVKQFNNFMNGVPARKIAQKTGYELYMRKLAKWVEEKPGEQPSLVKNYLRKIVKSKYFYWFLCYKIVGIFIKIGLVIYFLYFRPKKTQEPVKVDNNQK